MNSLIQFAFMFSIIFLIKLLRAFERIFLDFFCWILFTLIKQIMALLYEIPFIIHYFYLLPSLSRNSLIITVPGVFSLLRFSIHRTVMFRQLKAESPCQKHRIARQSLITTLTMLRPLPQYRGMNGEPVVGAIARSLAARKAAGRFAVFVASIRQWIMILLTITIAINPWNLLMLLTVTSSDVRSGTGASGER